jgi:YidC/Oxa1 family membrane protein insertase
MQKNIIIAVVLSSLIYIVWFTWVAPPPKNTSNNLQTQNQQTTQTQTIKEETKEISFTKQIENKIKPEYIIENEKAKYILSEDLSIIDVIYRGPVQDVSLVIDKSKPFLSILSDLKWKKVSLDKYSVTVAAKKEIEITKTIKISEKNHMNELILEFKNPTKNLVKIPKLELTLGPGLGTVKSEETENPKVWRAMYSYRKEGRKNPVIENIKNDYSFPDFLWTAIDNRYFLFAVMNENNYFDSIKYHEEKINDKKAPFISPTTKEITIKPGETIKMNIKFYSGPKDYELLKSFKNGLHLSIDFGFFAPLAKIANLLLKTLYKYTHNYGFAIILLSIIVQVVMLPLSLKSYKAMAIMKEMQPRMKEIQERYKKDPQRMNIEMMKLYKEYGANPFSGCWPMLLQIPIFFALFTTLRNSWDLHGAKFIFWIKDLSAKDPYYVLPIIMGALMYLQNYLTPQTSTDPSQTVIMKWMPLIFTFLFLTFPSGLVLYWIVNSVFSILQNYYLKKNSLITGGSK